MTRSPRRYLLTAFIPLLAMTLTAHPNELSAQSKAVQGRVKLEQARLAIEQEDFPKALTLFEEIIKLIGPKGEYQYHAAWAAYETGKFRKAKEYIYAAIEGEDEDFELMPEYDEAFRLAAEIENKVSKLEAREAAMDSLAARSTQLPFRDDLSEPGMAAVEAGKCESGKCEWRYANGGLRLKADERNRLQVSLAWLGGFPYRVSISIEERGSKKNSEGAGLAFGFNSWDDFSKLVVERKDDRDQGAWLRESERDRCGESCNSEWGRIPTKGKGPFTLRLEVRPFIDGRTQVTGYVDDVQVASYVVEYTIAGWVRAYVDEGEYVFRDLVIERLN